MYKPFESLDIDENKRFNEIEKKFLFSNESDPITPLNIYNNPTTIELRDENEIKFENVFNEVFNINITNYLDDYVFNEEEIKEIYFINKKRTNVFKITTERNENNKKGRLKIGETPNYDIKHDKFGKDDIIQKIKTKVINGLFSLINKLNSEYDLELKRKSEPLLTRINSDKYKIYSHKNNYEFLYANIGEFFSAETSKRNSTYPTDYNKIHIN